MLNLSGRESTNQNINTKQYEIFTEFFQEHPDLAKGQLKTVIANNLWKTVVSDLNAAGSPLRDVAGWKKVWADYKNNLKAKLGRNKSAISDTGGGSSKFRPLSPLEEQATQLLSMDEAASGISAALESSIGQGSSSQLSASIYVTESFEGAVARASSGSPENNTRHHKRGRFSSTTRDKENLLHRQVKNQIKYQQNSVKVLKNIGDSLRRITKYSKKNLELEEKLYKLKLEKFERENKYYAEKRKLTLMKLAIKKEMLDVKAVDVVSVKK